MTTEISARSPGLGMRLFRPLLNAVPVGISITGRRSASVLKLCDALSGITGGRGAASIAGAELDLDLAHTPERLLYYASSNLIRSYEDSELYILLKLVAKTAGLFVDIGANLGIYSLLARSLGLATASFEPEPRHSAFLKRNQRSLGRIYDCALSDANETARFFVAGTINSGASSLVGAPAARAGAQSEYDHSVEVFVKTFDSIIAGDGVDPSEIRLVKIDVEGNEARTVRGMQSYLRRPDAAPIWCEVRGPASGRATNSYAEVITIMAAAGFEPFQMNGCRLHPFRERDPLPTVFDLLFLHPRHAELRALCE